MSICWVWLGSNVAGANKRAAAVGIVFSLGNIGGAVSGQIYRAEWAPRYVQGHAINLGCYALALISGTALWWSYKTDNEKRDREAHEKIKRNKQDDLLGEDLGDLGDRCVRSRLATRRGADRGIHGIIGIRTSGTTCNRRQENNVGYHMSQTIRFTMTYCTFETRPMSHTSVSYSLYTS